MSFRVTQNSFSKGILSPSLQGRVDLEQYSLGLKNLKNGVLYKYRAKLCLNTPFPILNKSKAPFPERVRCFAFLYRVNRTGYFFIFTFQ